MAIGDELEKLSKLHQSGELSDAEYAKAKEAAIHGASAAPAVNPDDSFLGGMFESDNSLGTAANRYVSYQIVMGGIGLIVFLVIACGVISRMGGGATLFPYP